VAGKAAMALARERSGSRKDHKTREELSRKAFEKPSEAFGKSSWCSVHELNIALALKATSEGFRSLQARNPARRQGFILMHADSIDASLFIIFHMIALLSKMQGKEGSTPDLCSDDRKNRAVRAPKNAEGG
jgi:hypothetical protein